MGTKISQMPLIGSGSPASPAVIGSMVDLAAIATLSAALGDPVGTFVMTQSEYAAMTTRQGIRAEVLWGAGTVVGPNDVSMALRGK
jgi:hypothetical protein